MIDASDVNSVKTLVSGAEAAVKTEKDTKSGYEAQIRDDEDDIKTQKGLIEQVQKVLLEKEKEEREAHAKRDELLEEIAKQIGLTISKADSSTVQGSTATFTAKYNEADLPAGVEIEWDTGGCPIVDRDKAVGKDVVTVDTSSVQPGDYGVRVFVKLA
jgi:hypothetical protein